MGLVNLKAFSRWKVGLAMLPISAVHATGVNKRMENRTVVNDFFNLYFIYFCFKNREQVGLWFYKECLTVTRQAQRTYY